MIKNIFLPMVCFISMGCVPLVLGGGAAVGYALSNDSALGYVKGDFLLIWQEANNSLQQQGMELLQADQVRGVIVAKQGPLRVTIVIEKIASDVQKLKVSARKYLLPQPYIAQQIFIDIIKNVELQKS